jgi:hypothetical protein
LSFVLGLGANDRAAAVFAKLHRGLRSPLAATP